MRTFNVFAVIAFILVLIGALNWLIIGIFGFNLVTFITGTMVWLEKVIYILVGLSGIFLIIWASIAIPKLMHHDYNRE